MGITLACATLPSSHAAAASYIKVKVRTYDVHMEGSLFVHKEVNSGNPAVDGTSDTNLDHFTMDFDQAPVKFTTYTSVHPPLVTILNKHLGDGEVGVFRGTVSYDQNFQSNMCSDTLDVSDDAKLFLTGQHGYKVDSRFGITAFPATYGFISDVEDAEHVACPGAIPGIPSWPPDIFNGEGGRDLPNGLNFAAAGGAPGVAFQTIPTSGLPFPLDVIDGFEKFSWTTGPQQSTDSTCDVCTTTYDYKVDVVIRPHTFDIKALKFKDDVDHTLPLGYLSASTHDLFDGNTQVYGKIKLKGHPGDKLTSLKLQVLADDAEVAEGSLDPPAAAALLNHSFPSDGILEITETQLLFNVPSTQLGSVDQDYDGVMTLRAFGETEKGATDDHDYGPVKKLVRYLGANRYGPTDDAVGGDEWVLPHVKADLAQYAAGHCIGDASNMNGGKFAPHETHKDGDDTDVKFDTTACARSDSGGSFNNHSMADAQRLLDDLNDPAIGPHMVVVLVLLTYKTTDPFWATIRDATVSGGRRACRVVRSVAGHDTHFHVRWDRGDGNHGKCPGDPGFPAGG